MSISWSRRSGYIGVNNGGPLGIETTMSEESEKERA